MIRIAGFALLSSFYQVLYCQPKLIYGKLQNKHYNDTIPYNNKFDYLIITTNLNGTEKQLIFDTGAGMNLLSNDTPLETLKGNSRISDDSGNESKGGIGVIKELKISGLQYSDVSALTLSLPKPLACLSQGLIGNNIIERSNWKINSQFIIATDRKLKLKGLSAVKFYYHSGHRMFANLLINNARTDTCLIDYGGRFEVVFPKKDYEAFMKNVMPGYKLQTRIAGNWSINGKSTPDTTIVVNCSLNLNGMLMDDVNVVFSKHNNDRKIGVLLLNRFRNVYIDNRKKTIAFEGPVAARKKDILDMPFIVDLEDSKFVIESISTEVSKAHRLRIGDVIPEINGRNARSFSSYCEFLEWKLMYYH